MQTFCETPASEPCDGSRKVHRLRATDDELRRVWIFADVRSCSAERSAERRRVHENGNSHRRNRRRVESFRTFATLLNELTVIRRVTCWGFRGVRVGEVSNPGPLSWDDEPLIPSTVPVEVVDALEFDLTPAARRRRLRLVHFAPADPSPN